MRKASDYEPLESEPQGVRWKPVTGRPSHTTVTLYSTPGEFYKLVRVLETGEVTYYKRKDIDAIAKSPASEIDDEPVKAGQVRYHVGQFCWFVDEAGRWFCCEVMQRGRYNIVLRSTTGFDAERMTAWPYTEVLGFSSKSQLFKRLRPLKARQR